MPVAGSRDGVIVAALARRLATADAADLCNFAWFAARRGQLATALAAARRAVTLPDAPGAAWRTLERLASGRSDGLLLVDRGAEAAPAAGGASPLDAAVTAHCQGDARVADACYRGALAHPALAPSAWNGLGVLHEQRGERAAADVAWDHAAAGGAGYAVHNRALAMIRRGFPHRARSLLAAATARADAPTRARALAGYAALLDDDPAVAVALLGAVVAEDPLLTRAHFGLGLAYARLGRQREALLAIRTAVRQAPSYRPQVWCLDRGLGSPIIELAEERREPVGAFNTDDVLLALGRALLDGSHLGEALTIFDQILAEHPASPPALFHRGVALAKLRRYREAIADLDTVGRDHGELGAIGRRHARSARQLDALFAEH